MADVIYIVLMILFFASCFGLVNFLEKLKE